ncbi:hypothetical protein [Dyella japonica]|uniref:Uncharacterized protein n=2 Tax=Dyella japonica TaxID=231455 RepID=A0A075JWZ3_9GAMM|nr:hypothetical protein [Dyella japonica]AIF46007.1 hypothetical protein HY57_01355 [Dyella japonica A8]
MGLAHASTGDAAASAPPEAKGDWARYLHEHLPIPSPLVVYVYTSSGSLAGVMEMHVGDTADITHKIVSAIGTRNFADYSKPELSRTDATLKGYLADMGYSPQALVSSKTPYTLLVAKLGLQGEACANSLKVRHHIEQTVRDAANQPSVQGAYTVNALELEPSATFKINCQDSL